MAGEGYPSCAWNGCRGCDQCMQSKFDTSYERENTDLRRQLVETQAKLKQAYEDRDEYRTALHLVNEVKAKMTSAATSAAATAVSAIERIQEMEKVVEAAVAWSLGGSHATLMNAVKVWTKFKGTWS